MPPFIYLPQYCILKSHKAAVFPSLPWPSVSVICEFFKMTKWRKNAVKKKKNFQKVGQNGSLQTEYLVRGKESALSRQQKRMTL